MSGLKMYRHLVTVLTLLLLAGCRAGVTSDPAYIIPTTGSTVRINKQLVVPGGQTRVFIQRGQVVTKAKLDRYHPSCNFEVWKLRQRPTSIHPGNFAVTKVRRAINQVVSLEPVQVAGLRWTRYDDDHAMIMHVVNMWLQSAQQPNVYKLTCRSWLATPADAKQPNVADMREALGNYATITLIDGR
ncbi:MAG: hypothetical protein P8Z39_06330 [Gammaproteobacteria bacterium]